jgi:nucleoside-diphosphate-sugar epimerase
LLSTQVLVTGATGFVGRHLCAELARRGIPFRSAVRANRGLEWAHRPVVVGEIGGATDWSAALDGVDAVVHLAAHVHTSTSSAVYRRVNAEGTERVARAVAARGIRLIHVSTIGVHGRATSDLPLVETSPLRPHDPYTRSKCEGEQRLRSLQSELGLDLTILRPPLIYGPGSAGSMRQLLRLICGGVPLPLGSIENSRSLVYVENMVDLLIACLSGDRAAGRTFVVSDGQDLSTPELIRKLAGQLGRRARLYPFPVAVLRQAALATGMGRELDGLTRSLQVDSSNVRSALGWKPPFAVDDGLRRTCAWYQTQPRLAQGRFRSEWGQAS